MERPNHVELLLEIPEYIKMSFWAMDEGENSYRMSFWATTCYSLWFWRNKLVHDDTFVMPMNPCTEVKRKTHHYNVAAKQGMVAGCGGIFEARTESGFVVFRRGWELVVHMLQNFGGVFEGLKLARLRGFHKVELDIDSSVVASTLALGEGGSMDGGSLLQNIRRLLELEWEIKIRHSYRQANKCADALTNMACDGGYSSMLYEHCHAQINLLFLADSIGISTPHYVKR